MSAIYDKLRRDVAQLQATFGGADIEIGGYVLVAVSIDDARAADPIAIRSVIRSVALPDDALDQSIVLDALRNGLSEPIRGNE